MPMPKKDGMPGGTATKVDGRTQNGNRQGFRTDTAISNNRFGNERTLQPWVPDSTDASDGSLEASTSGRPWDQFAENERLFGLKTDYDENIYTTAINKSHPQYKERYAAAEKKAREIERSAPVTSHVAEERVMDYTGGNGPAGENEEDKYSGVRRQDFPPLSTGRENRYMPPAKRAPTSQSTAPSKRQPTPSDQTRAQAVDAAKNGVSAKPESQKASQSKPVEDKAGEAKPATAARDSKTPESKPADKAADKSAATGPASGRNLAPPTKEGAPSATSTVERDVLNSFKSFASQQRINAEKVRSSKARADKEVKLTELKKFATSFKLSTPVPSDLVSIIAKDPVKQKEIQAKAMKNAEDMAKTKAEIVTRDKAQGTKETQAKPAEQNAAVNTTGPAGPSNRHTGPRQAYTQPPYHAQPYRSNRGAPQHAPQHTPQQQTGNLAQRLRHVEQQRYSQPLAPSQHQPNQDMRAPPTGPSNNVDAGFNRRLSGAPGHMGAKLNPNSHEFRPSPFAASFNPNGHPSASSSPRAPVNHVAESPASAAAHAGHFIRRKTKAVDVRKCYILSHVGSISPSQGRNWDDNGGLRPPYDTPPTWRQLQDDEKSDSTMHLTYKEYFERQPFSNQTMNTPNPPHHSSHSIGPRQSPHMPPMQMHTPQQGPVPHPPFGGADDHRMLHSNSAQSFASPRMAQQMPVAYPNQVPYNQPVFMSPQMGQYRTFSGNPHYVPPQQGQMSGPVMMQPQFMPGPQGMMAAPQMMYHGGHPQFMPPSGPPQPVPGATGYPSPGRPAAPVMVHQGSQQGQPMYGMSPSVQYNQPAYGPGQGSGPMPNVGGHNGLVWHQHVGTSWQQTYHYGPL
ncbi:lsmAD domain-containing protein [Hirsutella rhossiliensis]|uniref:LsmAD domain-containing protein n=1 Tax=Hirsutella rhossiliensis TaxID=111463 RepID=A0A9P8N4R5_9HYPO|nr:lsmAD domain-containing protein [Hirsutella rhossiliensis]KAH0966932.1 lsmAD domain-containing protein [Hirsutella rhossiliensis]